MSDLYSIYKKSVPANARTLLESLFTKEPITENNFTEEELNVIREMAKLKQPAVSYFDYPQKEEAQRGAGFTFDNPLELIKKSYENPSYSMMGTLGSYNIKEDKNSITATDRYNFDNKDIYKMTGKEDVLDMIRRMWKWKDSPAGALDQLLIRYGNIDRPVNIKIKK